VTHEEKNAHMNTNNFLGIPVHALSYDDMFSLVDKWLHDKTSRSHHIACLNAYCITLAADDPHLAGIYSSADIAGPDGMPFVYWIRWINRLRCDRFYAPDVVLQLAERARTTGYSFYLYGGSPEVVLGMKAYLEQRFPYLRIIGCHSPPFRELTEREDIEICMEINDLKPDIICVGLGTPKQDFWIDSHLYRIRGSVMVSAGATFDFFGGRVRIAPKIIQRSGFEWLYRLIGPDFKRLFKRYTIMNIKFIWNFGLQLLGLRARIARHYERAETSPD